MRILRTHVFGRRPAASRGVTLLEMLIVIAIIGILVLIGLPNYSRIIMMARLRASSNDLLMKIRHVRSLAIKTQRELHMSFNLPNQSFMLRKPGHTEYNLLEDLATASADGSLGNDKYILYVEKGGGVCVDNWNEARVSQEKCEDGYYIGGGRKKNGIDTDLVTDCPSNTITVNPSGTLGETCDINMTNKWLGRTYTIRLYRGGQVRILGFVGN